MVESIEVDICVIGAGSGGLSVAAGASQMGASVVLIEKGRMGGDCLNYGCVPSKALIAAAGAAQTIRDAARFGVDTGRARVDFRRVHDHVHGVIAAIAVNDSVARFEALGVRVIEAPGRFVGRREVEAGGIRVRARRVVIATGSSPALPPIAGLADTPHLTNETIFDLDKAPVHLIVIGGGPIGVELAQAYRRLGAKVTLIEALSLMGRDDPELVDIVRACLGREGVDLREGVKVERVERTRKGVAVLTDGGRVEGSHLLVATGRTANIGGLGLDRADIEHGPDGIPVDARLRTSNRRVFAIGDVTGGLQFTHVAGYHAGIVLRNVLFRLPAKADHRAVPSVTYCEPELAQVGLSEAAARAAHGEIRILRWPFHENDRAQATRQADGLLKAITDRRGRVLGAGIVGPHAGELIQIWVLAVAKRLKIGDLASPIAPYPTLGEVTKRAAGSFYLPGLLAPRTRKLVRFLARFG